MRERAQATGGTVAVESPHPPGGGTRISVRLPLQTVPEAVDEPERQAV
jgi:signal transduction histidine kinase